MRHEAEKIFPSDSYQEIVGPNEATNNSFGK